MGNYGEILFRDTGATYGYNTNSNVYVAGGEFYATVKHFKIPHPTKDGYLVYSSVESPYNGIQLTGYDIIVNKICKVKLPDYINKLIYGESVTIQITPVKHYKIICIENIDIENNNFEVSIENFDHSPYEFFWTLTAERKDIEKLISEQE